MDTVDKLSKYLSDKGITDITVVGAPKTIDNDLCGTDHCPGFEYRQNISEPHLPNWNVTATYTQPRP